VTILTRLVRIETERTHRRRRRVAEAVAPLEGIPFDVAYARTFVAPTDQAAVLARFGRGLVDVAELVRWMAGRSGLTSEETTEAIAQAERVHARFQAREEHQ
jgi:hypothetical protein